MPFPAGPKSMENRYAFQPQRTTGQNQRWTTGGNSGPFSQPAAAVRRGVYNVPLPPPIRSGKGWPEYLAANRHWLATTPVAATVALPTADRPATPTAASGSGEPQQRRKDLAPFPLLPPAADDIPEYLLHRPQLDVATAAPVNITGGEPRQLHVTLPPANQRGGPYVSPWSVADMERKIGTYVNSARDPDSHECVALVKAFVPSLWRAADWVRGLPIDQIPDGDIKPGTAIGTGWRPDPPHSYISEHGESHVAIVTRVFRDAEGNRLIEILEQYNGGPAHLKTLKPREQQPYCLVTMP